MQVVYYCLWEAWDPAWFEPDYCTRKLRNEAFCRENLEKTPNTKERSNHYASSTQKALRTWEDGGRRKFALWEVEVFSFGFKGRKKN